MLKLNLKMLCNTFLWKYEITATSYSKSTLDSIVFFSLWCALTNTSLHLYRNVFFSQWREEDLQRFKSFIQIVMHSYGNYGNIIPTMTSSQTIKGISKKSLSCGKFIFVQWRASNQAPKRPPNSEWLQTTTKQKQIYLKIWPDAVSGIK